MTTRDEARTENLKIWQKEPRAFAEMLLDFTHLNLKRIDILGDRNDHKHDGLSEDKQYLIVYSGYWYMASAYFRDGYEWSFSFGHFSSVGLRNLDIVFEITTDLPKIKKNALERIEQDECAEVGTGECHYLCTNSMDCEYLKEYELNQ